MPKRVRLCVDMHVHLGASRDGGKLSGRGIQKLLEEYPVTHAVVFPIDEPDSGASYARMNAKVAALTRQDKRIIGFCRLDPRQKDAAFKEIKRAVHRGLRGVKLHPRSEDFSPQTAEDLFPAIEKEKFPVLLHTSHEHHCHPALWESLFRKHPKINFILAHAGKDAYQEAGAVASRCSNVYLETSTLSYGRTSVLFKTLGPGKMVFASDVPYSHPAVELAKWELILRGNPSAQRKIFEENPKRILGGLP